MSGPEKVSEREAYKHFLSYSVEERLQFFRDEEGKPYSDDIGFARVHDVDPATLYRWRKDPKFNQELTKLMRSRLLTYLPDMLQALIQTGQRGGMTALETYFDMLGDADPRKIQEEEVSDSASLDFESPEFRIFFAQKLAELILDLPELKGLKLDQRFLANKIVKEIDKLVEVPEESSIASNVG